MPRRLDLELRDLRCPISKERYLDLGQTLPPNVMANIDLSSGYRLVPRLCLETLCFAGSARGFDSRDRRIMDSGEAEPRRLCVPRQSLGTSVFSTCDQQEVSYFSQFVWSQNDASRNCTSNDFDQ